MTDQTTHFRSWGNACNLGAEGVVIHLVFYAVNCQSRRKKHCLWDWVQTLGMGLELCHQHAVASYDMNLELIYVKQDRSQTLSSYNISCNKLVQCNI